MSDKSLRMETNEEIDLLHWRIDQLQEMVKDLALRLGQEELAFGMVQFHNNEVVPAMKEMRAVQEDKP